MAGARGVGGEDLEGLDDHAMLIGPERAFAQPQHVGFVVAQGDRVQAPRPTHRATADRVTAPCARPSRQARPRGRVYSQAGVRPWLSVAKGVFPVRDCARHARRALRRSVAARRRGCRDFLRVLFANGDTGYTYPSPFVILVAAGSWS